MNISLTRLGLTFVLALLCCAGCGLKGDLYLPDESPPAQIPDYEEDDPEHDEY